MPQNNPEPALDTDGKLKIIDALLQKHKALDIEVIALGEEVLLADYFVVCTGTSNTHIRAIADALLVDGKKEGLLKKRTEGYSQAKWVLIDYGDIVVHIFSDEERAYYDLESLWRSTADKLRVTK
jgi:ribosome-associated protein